MNTSAIKKIVFILLICLCFSASALGKKTTKIPVKVNILQNSTMSEDDVKKMIKFANYVLRKAGVKLQLKKPVNTNVSDGGNNDGKIQESESRGIDRAGRQELNAAFGKGRGIKIYLGNELYDDPNTHGLAVHVTKNRRGRLIGAPTIYLKNDPNTTTKFKGRVLAHEACHILTLGDVSRVLPKDGNTPAKYSDSNGHVDDSDPNLEDNIMGEKIGEDSTKLTEDQKKEIAKGAKRHVKKSKTAIRKEKDAAAKKRRTKAAYKVSSIDHLIGGTVDDIGETTCSNLLDIDNVHVFSEEPHNGIMEISITLNGIFEDGTYVNQDYYIGFDIDNNDATGVALGSALGIDKRSNINITGSSYNTIATRATIYDTITYDDYFLPGSSLQRIKRIRDTDNYTNSSTIVQDGIYLEVPMEILNAPEPIDMEIIIATQGSGPICDEAILNIIDTSETEPHIELASTQLAPFETILLTGKNFTPNASFNVEINDRLIAISTVAPDGTIDNAINFIPEPTDLENPDILDDITYFIVVEDDHGLSDHSIIELVPNDADLDVNTAVTFSDFAIFAENWLVGTTINFTVPDYDAPNPNPPTWQTTPYYYENAGQYYHSMTVNPCTDESSPIQYKFDCVAGTGISSSYQQATTYIAGPFATPTVASYTVTAQDTELNTTSPSAIAQITDDLPPTPNPTEWEITPRITGTTGAFYHEMQATQATDNTMPIQYKFECTSGPGQTRDYSDPDNQNRYYLAGPFATPNYATYTVTARDALGNETTPSVAYFMQDDQPPYPNPSQWLLVPYMYESGGQYYHHMTAAVSNDDVSAIQYKFVCTIGQGTSSNWINEPNNAYTAGPFSIPTYATYEVIVRDASGNETTPSSPGIIADTTAPQPNPSTWDTPPYSYKDGTFYRHTMTATTSTDDSGQPVLYSFTCSQSAYSSGWQSSPTYTTDAAHWATTGYTYSVQVKDQSGNTTTASPATPVNE